MPKRKPNPVIDIRPMDAVEFINLRRKLGYTQEQIAATFILGKWGRKTVVRWEREESKIPGSVAFAMRAMDAGCQPDLPA